MTILEYSRQDLTIAVRRAADDQIMIEISSLTGSYARSVPPALAQTWLQSPALDEIPGLAELLGLQAGAVPFWKELFDRQPANPQEIFRIALDIRDRVLAALPWEESLYRQIVQSHPLGSRVNRIVRLSHVFPRVASIPLTLPVRFLQVDPSPAWKDVPGILQDIFYWQDPGLVDKAVQAATCTFHEIESWRGTSGWPTAEVLHFDTYPLLNPAHPDSGNLLSSARSTTPGTLGWLARLADTWQTRLIILHCQNPEQARAARQLAHGLANRGGPAILVGEAAPPPGGDSPYAAFYDLLIHDRPIDATDMNWENPSFAYFLGSGREEILRVSAPVQKLENLKEDLTGVTRDAFRDIVDYPASELRQMLARAGKTILEDWSSPLLDDILSKVETISTTAKSYRYHDHESGGLLPSADALDSLRRLIGVRRPASPVEALPKPPAEPGVESAQAPPDRHVNAFLCQLDPEGKPDPLYQMSARLVVGEIYQAGFQVGPKNEAIITIGNTALVEEVIKWKPDLEGVWLQIGLTGLDFEILGDPVQEFWLPKNASVPAEPLYFTVIPQKPGVSRLRYCIYYQNEVIQSGRLAALSRLVSDSQDLPLSEQIERLSQALDVPGDTISEKGTPGYLARVEYRATADFPVIANEARRKRTLSLVANDLDGETVVTVKGGDVYDVRANVAVETQVKNTRQVMDKIATDRHGSDDPDGWEYRFDIIGVQKLKDALCDLAGAGWTLYTSIIGGKNRQALAEQLAGEGHIIQVAHILVEKVIPWAAVYDRRFDPRRTKDPQGRQLTKDACLAAIPKPDGSLPAARCGQLPNCLLNKAEDDIHRKALEDVTACPLHFWGYQHILELPPQQVQDEEGHEQRTCTIPRGPLQLAAAFNETLPLAGDHFQHLKGILSELSLKGQWSKQSVRDDIVYALLERDDLDLVYLYCHANDKDEAQGILDPYLEFQESSQVPAGQITAADLAGGPFWGNAPLVFLNGCRTAGFSPKALTPFIPALVEDRGAAGIIGTEIYTWEPLADDMALRFLTAFFSGSQAGEALMKARRTLLANYNPLGIIYTLYAAADLAIDLDGDGKCL